MATIGRIEHFNQAVESWDQYAERIDHFFDANGITNTTKKRSTLLTAIGPTTYNLLSSLVAPQKATDKSYDDIVQLLKDHHSPAPSEIVQRYRFHSRVREPGESTTQFVAELRSLAQHCKFGDAFLDLLRDRIVCGINDEHVQRRLLAEKELSFDKALELAISLETAKKNVTILQPGSRQRNALAVLKVTKTDTSCYRCGGRGHGQEGCKFRQTRCYLCGKIGHIKKVCRSGQKPDKKKPRDHKVQPIRQLSEEEEVTFDQAYINNLHKLSEDNPSILVTVLIEKKPVKMELDTGASVSILSLEEVIQT